MIEVNEVH